MKKTIFVVALALVLTFAFVASASATTFKGFGAGLAYYTWTKTAIPAGAPAGSTTPAGLSGIGANPTNPGAHANYLATTAKCGICHSVHRATAGGTKLLPTADATCAGCHTGSTPVTSKIVTWTGYSTTLMPDINPAYPGGLAGWAADMRAGGAQRTNAMLPANLLNKAAFGAAATTGGPHNDSLLNIIEDGGWDPSVDPVAPEPGYELGHRYGCFTRRCHATNPHGAGGSKYKLFAAKLLFNNSANADQEGDGTYGGLDAVYDDLGATDAAVQRFIDENPTLIQGVDDGTGKFDLQIKNVAADPWRAPDANEVHTLVAGLTCGRPSNPSTGEDECHAEASYAIFSKGVQEMRNKSTGITRGAYAADNTGGEVIGWGGNDSRTAKTAHVAGTFAAVPANASYAGIAGCTSCHDQTDAANSTGTPTDGHFTFPHGQNPTGATNLADNTSATPHRARIWMGYGANVGAPLTSVGDSNQKAYDGNCLKCHRDGAGNGIGLTQ